MATMQHVSTEEVKPKDEAQCATHTYKNNLSWNLFSAFDEIPDEKIDKMTTSRVS